MLSYLTNIESHMHVLKPEAIKATQKNIQNVLTNIKKSFIYIYIYIFLYIYIYGPSQENGETIMHKQSSRSEMSKQTEKKAKPGR